MGLFTKKKERSPDLDRERVAGRIAGKLLALQRRSANWLNSKASKLGQSNVLLILMIMGLGFGLWFGWLILGVLF